MKPSLPRIIARSLLRVFFIVLAVAIVGLLVAQHGMIYHPRHYGNVFELQLPKNAVELKYRTSQGAQLSFYLPPRDGSHEPQRVWVLFGGNGSLALDWTDFLSRLPKNGDGFLLPWNIPAPAAARVHQIREPIEESAEKAFLELASTLHLTPAQLDARLNILGHSLGCAAALQFAVHHPAQRVVLLAPFTSLRDMARRTVGFPLNWLLLHNFDNRARLAELAARPTPPRVAIIHATDDQVIPCAMGRELAGMFPKMIRFYEIADADHDSVLYDATNEIREAMAQ